MAERECGGYKVFGVVFRHIIGICREIRAAHVGGCEVIFESSIEARSARTEGGFCK